MNQHEIISDEKTVRRLYETKDCRNLRIDFPKNQYFN